MRLLEQRQMERLNRAISKTGGHLHGQ